MKNSEGLIYRDLFQRTRPNPPISHKMLSKKLDGIKEESKSVNLSQTERDTLNQEIIRMKEKLLSADVEVSLAEYILEWWWCRLRLIKVMDGSKSDSDLTVINNYMRKNHIEAYEMTFDGEFAIENYERLIHFCDLASSNPYFRQLSLPSALFKITFKVYKYRHDDREDFWLGFRMPNVTTYYGTKGYPKDVTAAKIIRGRFIGLPIGQEATDGTEIPLELLLNYHCPSCGITGRKEFEQTLPVCENMIYSFKNVIIDEVSRTIITKEHKCNTQTIDGVPTRKPSDIIKFLEDAESNLKTARFFIPVSHQPFMTFPDGMSWVIVPPGPDRALEGASLRDCGRPKWDRNTIIISLREKVPVGDTIYYKSHLKAEIVFQSDSNTTQYEEIKKQFGIIHQLRGISNTKPSKDLHKYIIPLIEQSWIRFIVKPTYFRVEDSFEIKDLSSEEINILKYKNESLFDAKSVYLYMKDSYEYPYDLKQQIMDAIILSVNEVESILSASKEDLESAPNMGALIPKAISSLSDIFKNGSELDKQRINSVIEFIYLKNYPDEFKKLLDNGWTPSESFIHSIFYRILQGEFDNTDGDSSIARIMVYCKNLSEESKRLALKIILKYWEYFGSLYSYFVSAGILLSAKQCKIILENMFGEAAEDTNYFYAAYNNQFKYVVESMPSVIIGTDYVNLLPLFRNIVLSPKISIYTLNTILNKIKLSLLSKEEILNILLKSKNDTQHHLAIISAENILPTLPDNHKQEIFYAIQKFVLRSKSLTTINMALKLNSIPQKFIVNILKKKTITKNLFEIIIHILNENNRSNIALRRDVIKSLYEFMLLSKDNGRIEILFDKIKQQSMINLVIKLVKNKKNWVVGDADFVSKLVYLSIPGVGNKKSMPNNLYNLLKYPKYHLLSYMLISKYTFDDSVKIGKLLNLILEKSLLKDPEDYYNSTKHKICNFIDRGDVRLSTYVPLNNKLFRLIIKLVNNPDIRMITIATTIAKQFTHEEKKRLNQLLIIMYQKLMKSEEIPYNVRYSYKENLKLLIDSAF